MRTGIVYSYRLFTVNYRAGQHARPIAIAGIGPHFTFTAARVQPVDGDEDPILARVLRTFHVDLAQRIADAGTPGLVQWIDTQRFDHFRALDAAAPEERTFTLTPKHNVLTEAGRVYRDIVLGRKEEKLLEPPGVWARELPVFNLYPSHVIVSAASR